MATSKRLTLDVWIQNAMSDEKDGRKCSMLALVHVIGSSQKEVASFKFGSGKNPTAQELADNFRSRAEGFAQDLSGTQMFQLLAFYGKNEPEAFQPFAVQPAIDPLNPLPSEPATESGKLAQIMRQSEMQFQAMMRQTIALSEAQTNFMMLQARMVADLHAQNQAYFQGTKDLLMEQALNTQKHEMERLQYARSSEERKKWMTMIPLLANTILGKEIFPQSNADTVLMEQIVESIDQDTIMVLGQFVKPELMGPLMERFTQIQAKKRLEKENASRALLAPSSVSGEDDAGGGKE